MSTSIKLFFVILVVAISQSSIAAVFKCEENGEITFSDKPCSDKSQNITSQKLNVIPNKTSADSTLQATRMKKMADEMESVRMQREINQKISLLESEIDEKKQSRDKKLLELEDKKSQIGYGDDYDEELLVIDLKKLISDEEIEVKNQYSLEIEALTQKIKDLRDQLDKYKP